MKRRKDLSVSSIYTNWVAVRNAKLAKLSKNNSNDSCKLPIINDSKDKQRLSSKSKQEYINKPKQEFSSKSKQGFFHVFVRGYNSYTLFYDNEDRVHFLLILDEEAKKRETRISAFILMDNHFHLQITTSMLSSLMSIVLSRYSRRFRKKYGLDGPVFKNPFGRSEIFSLLLAKENLLYILSNASRERMCSTHRDYIWSSYNSHPELMLLRREGMLPILGRGKYATSHLNSKDPLPTPKRGRGSLPSARLIAKSDINQVIEIDTSFMVSSFKDLQDLDYAIHTYKPLRPQLVNNQRSNSQPINNQYLNNHQINNQSNHPFNNPIHSVSCDSKSQNLPRNNNFYQITPDSEVIDLFINLLDGRKLTSLTNNERSQIIVKLKRIKKATNRQISSIMRM